MKIKKINLFNFGSYLGKNSMDLADEHPEKRVVVIGGKNGAGKTTLFTAIQVCLYGHYAFGYRNAGKHYLKEIHNLINNQVRLDENADAYVEIDFEQVTHTEQINYTIRRAWKWPDQIIEEELTVSQNGKQLAIEELTNFQNYLIHLIPPDLLKLYFFDGEKVADYFLGNQEVNIRDALMVLSGNDTFDILFENVKRVLRISENVQGEAAQSYIEAKRRLAEIDQEINDTKAEIIADEVERETLGNRAAALTKEYSERGGVTIVQWVELHNKLKAEEERRERLNWQRKALATDVLPFIIAEKLVKRVAQQIKNENDYAAYKSLKCSLDNSAFREMLIAATKDVGSANERSDGKYLYEKISAFLLDSHWESFVPLFGLSDDEKMQVQAVLNRVNSYDEKAFHNYQRRITASLVRSKEVRDIIQNSDIEHFEEYIRELTRLEEEQRFLAQRITQTSARLETLNAERLLCDSKLRLSKKAFEEQLRKQSVSALSGRVLLLLEELQGALYAKLINRVEQDINSKFRELIRKKNFFTEVKIDDDFSIHILRNQFISKEDLLSLLRGTSFSVAKRALGEHAIDALQEQYGVHTVPALHKAIRNCNEPGMNLPVEINKDRLSSGEKQIFVMSLYWAMMNQSKNELPYVIDTPFARIDTQHRSNITQHFFKKLNGQLLVLSTDEEISSNHITALREQISRVYMLEYGQDKCTHIHENEYFEV